MAQTEGILRTNSQGRPRVLIQRPFSPAPVLDHSSSLSLSLIQVFILPRLYISGAKAAWIAT